jgi:hypothetical protein
VTDQYLDQRQRALLRANEVRLTRAARMQELERLPIGESEERAAELILLPPDDLDTQTVYDLLVRVHRYGHRKVLKLLNTLGISERKTVGALSQRQRQELARRLTRKRRSGAQQQEGQ